MDARWPASPRARAAASTHRGTSKKSMVLRFTALPPKRPDAFGLPGTGARGHRADPRAVAAPSSACASSASSRASSRSSRSTAASASCARRRASSSRASAPVLFLICARACAVRARAPLPRGLGRLAVLRQARPDEARLLADLAIDCSLRRCIVERRCRDRNRFARRRRTRPSRPRTPARAKCRRGLCSAAARRAIGDFELCEQFTPLLLETRGLGSVGVGGPPASR